MSERLLTPSAVPFQARIASIALVTTVAVLVAACLSFMLQQWVVSRKESRESILAVSSVVAELAAPAIVEGDRAAVGRAARAALASSAVVHVQIVDRNGVVLVEDHRAGADPASISVRTQIVHDGAAVGAVIVQDSASVAPLIPRYLALTAALFFGAAGLALFLAQALARRVIMPVARLSATMDEFLSTGRIAIIVDEADDDLFRSLEHKFNMFLTMVEPKREETQLAFADDGSGLATSLSPEHSISVSGEVGASHEIVEVRKELQVIRAPRWGWFVLALVCPRDKLEGIAGDIDEEYRQCFIERGERSANWFYCSQIIRSTLPLLWHGLQGLISLARLFKGG